MVSKNNYGIFTFTLLLGSSYGQFIWTTFSKTNTIIWYNNPYVDIVICSFYRPDHADHFMNEQFLVIARQSRPGCWIITVTTLRRTAGRLKYHELVFWVKHTHLNLNTNIYICDVTFKNISLAEKRDYWSRSCTF